MKERPYRFRESPPDRSQTPPAPGHGLPRPDVYAGGESPDRGDCPGASPAGRLEVRARFVAVASSIAAEARPLPESAWARVDWEDLPPSFSKRGAGGDRPRRRLASGRSRLRAGGPARGPGPRAGTESRRAGEEA